jgi:hypothetical protein
MTPTARSALKLVLSLVFFAVGFCLTRYAEWAGGSLGSFALMLFFAYLGSRHRSLHPERTMRGRASMTERLTYEEADAILPPTEREARTSSRIIAACAAGLCMAALLCIGLNWKPQ